jgi:Na+/H+ antiporter NhaC
MHVKIVEKPWPSQRGATASLCSGAGAVVSGAFWAELTAPLSNTASNASDTTDVRTCQHAPC